jgi:hypothetical protein
VIVGRIANCFFLNFWRARDIESIDKECVMLSKQIKSWCKESLSENKTRDKTQEETVCKETDPKTRPEKEIVRID